MIATLALSSKPTIPLHHGRTGSWEALAVDNTVRDSTRADIMCYARRVMGRRGGPALIGAWRNRLIKGWDIRNPEWCQDTRWTMFHQLCTCRARIDLKPCFHFFFSLYWT